jgi:hypothetical protein
VSALRDTARGGLSRMFLSNIGSQACLKCGNELISWNGPRDYIEFRLEEE